MNLQEIKAYYKDKTDSDDEIMDQKNKTSVKKVYYLTIFCFLFSIIVVCAGVWLFELFPVIGRLIIFFGIAVFIVSALICSELEKDVDPRPRPRPRPIPKSKNFSDYWEVFDSGNISSWEEWQFKSKKDKEFLLLKSRQKNEQTEKKTIVHLHYDCGEAYARICGHCNSRMSQKELKCPNCGSSNIKEIRKDIHTKREISMD